MRILQVAPPWERVPPPAYGGTEAVVSLLADGLAQAGHGVVLRASGDSISLAELRSVYPRSLRTAEDVNNGTPYEWVHVAEAIAGGEEFGIVHNHAGEPMMALAARVHVPMLTTTRCLIPPDTEFVWQRHRRYYNAISCPIQRSAPHATP